MSKRKYGKLPIKTVQKDAPLCFVAMPFGRTPEEAGIYKEWYEGVLAPAIKEAGYKPFLSAAQNAPIKITDDIRAHLVSDPMAVFDLAGLRVEDLPNPNVMYELGFRHAHDRPSVILGWSGQLLPFDISEQSAILEARAVGSIRRVHDRLVECIQNAAAGLYYKPMETVRRTERLDQATSGDEALVLLRDEMRAMKASIESLGQTLRPRPESGVNSWNFADDLTNSYFKPVSGTLALDRKKRRGMTLRSLVGLGGPFSDEDGTTTRENGDGDDEA
jgi:hypothetical protein